MTTNARHWQPKQVTTIDGRQCMSDSEDWRRCCEAVHVLNMTHPLRREWLADVGKRRGAEGLRTLTDEMDRIEPAYMLAMPSKDDRRAYLASVERHIGVAAKEGLEKALFALWEQRKAAQAVTA